MNMFLKKSKPRQLTDIEICLRRRVDNAHEQIDKLSQGCLNLVGRIEDLEKDLSKNRRLNHDRFTSFSSMVNEIDKKITTTNEVNKVLHQMLRDKEVEGKTCATCKHYVMTDRGHWCGSWTAKEAQQ